MKLSLAVSLAFATPALAAAAPAINPMAIVQLQDLAQTRDRPLFSPNRRPPPAHAEAPPAQATAVAEPKPVADEPPPFDLVGVVVGDNTRFVLLASRSGAVSRLRAGDERDGWRVGEISIRSVSLERDGHERSLALAEPAQSAAAPEVAQQQIGEVAMTPGPVREEYKRLMRKLAIKP